MLSSVAAQGKNNKTAGQAACKVEIKPREDFNAISKDCACGRSCNGNAGRAPSLRQGKPTEIKIGITTFLFRTGLRLRGAGNRPRGNDRRGSQQEGWIGGVPVKLSFATEGAPAGEARVSKLPAHACRTTRSTRRCLDLFRQLPQLFPLRKDLKVMNFCVGDCGAAPSSETKKYRYNVLPANGTRRCSPSSSICSKGEPRLQDHARSSIRIRLGPRKLGDYSQPR